MAWGAQVLPSGMVALCSTVPIALGTLVLSAAQGEVRLSVTGGLGVSAALLGLLAFAVPNATSPVPLLPVLAVITGALAYAWESVQSRHLGRAYSPQVLTTLPLLLGGSALLVLSACLEPWPTWRSLRAAGASTALSLGYLIACGSMLGFFVYQRLLRVWPASQVANYAFVSPLVAAVLGTVLLGERWTPLQLLGGGLMLTGAALTLLGQPRPRGPGFPGWSRESRQPGAQRRCSAPENGQG